MLLPIIPYPERVKFLSGNLVLSNSLSVKCDEQDRDDFILFGSMIKKEISFSSNALIVAEKSKREGYEIIINESITIHYSNDDYRFCALMSLFQLIYKSKELPYCEIYDKARFNYRAFMLDVSRHYMSTDFIKRLLHSLAIHHINIFHWHLNDDQGFRFEVDNYPKVASLSKDRGLYTKSEIKEIVDLAKKLHISVIPELDVPGHSLAILAAYPELGCTKGPYKIEDKAGVFEDVLCVSNKKAIDFVKAALDTLFTLFDSPYIHIGGDECPHVKWESCPSCSKLAKEMNIDISDLQAVFTKEILEYIHEKTDKRVCAWQEVVENKLFEDKSILLYNWIGKSETIIKALKDGYDIIQSPNTHGCYLDYKQNHNKDEKGQLGITTFKDSYNFDPYMDVNDKNKHQIKGCSANLWTESVFNDEDAAYMIYPRLTALSEVFYTETKDYNSIKKRLKDHMKMLKECFNIISYDKNLE